MKNLSYFLAAVFLISLTAGCNSKSTISENEYYQTIVEKSLNNSITQGNHTYIPFRVRYPYDQIKKVFEILNRFEKQHPELKIIHWHLETGLYTTAGLWIDHEPRE